MGSSGLTPEDFDRIRTFLEKPKYDRDPEDLMPSETDGGREGE
ncbi:MAG: hypothetical protein ABEJ78_11080 [Haloferacaceae archaeon]